MSSTAVWVRRGERGWWRVVAAVVAIAMVAVGLITVLPLTSYADTANGSPDDTPGVFLYNAGVDSSGTPTVGPRPGGGPCDGVSGSDPTGPAIVEAVGAGDLYFIGDVPQEVESFNTGGAGETDANSTPDPDLAAVNTGLTTVDDYGFIGNTGDDDSNYDAGTGGDIRLTLDANDDEPNAPAGPIDLIIPDGEIASGQISDTSGGTTLDLDGSEIFIFEDAATSGMIITLLGDGDPVTIIIDDYQRNPDAPGEADDTLIAIDLDSLAGFNGRYVGEIIITDDDIPTSPPGRSDCDTSQTANVIDTSLEIDAVATRTDTVLLGEPIVLIEKATNGVDADAPAEAVEVIAGSTVTWTYVVTNTGQVDLVSLEVLDDQIPASAINCDGTGSNVIAGPIAPSDSFTCVATGTAGTAPYTNNSVVTGIPINSDGEPATGVTVSDEDPSNYIPVAPSIELEKATNGADADTAAAAVQLLPGDAITWTYEVTNNGTTNLINVEVTDNQGVVVTCPGGNPIPQLPIGATITCTGTGTAGTTAYTNIGEVDGTPADAAFVAIPGAIDVSDTDPSNYVVNVDAAIDIEKTTNGSNADVEPGPSLVVGETVTWTYVVTNSGSVPLVNVTVTDVPAQSLDCDGTGGPTVAGPLPAGGSFSCTATGTATAGQYRNDSSVVGTPSDAAGNPVGLPDVNAQDPSHYFGQEPSIDIEKSTNGVQADLSTPPNPITVGDSVQWLYVVTNNGLVNLVDVTVVDSEGVTVSCGEGTGNVINDLAPGESVNCFGNGVATFGEYENEGSVVGTPADAAGNAITGVPTVDDADLSHYVGEANPAVEIEKATNGVDADTPAEGPGVAPGTTVTWTYVVRNIGDVPLTNVTVTDDPAADIACVGGGGTNVLPGPLPVNGLLTCTATGTAGSVPFANNSTVVATPSDDAGNPLDIPGVPTVTAEDPSHYNPLQPGLTIEKSTNGQDSDLPAGQPIPVGDTVTWTYEVTNSGAVPLAQVEVTDNLVAAADIDCAATGSNVIAVILPGDTVTCEATGTAIVGPYANDSTATGLPSDAAGTPIPGQPPVTDQDPSNYFGQATPAVQIEKTTNGVDSDVAPGETILEGGAVVWEYTITNIGETDLVSFTVTDSEGAVLDCDGTGGSTVAGPIAPNGSFTCTASDVAIVGQYTNDSEVIANPVDSGGAPLVDISGNPVGTVSDEDPSNYFGAAPDISLTKTVNGNDANAAPGPSLSVTGAVPTFDFIVENTGNVPLVNVTVTDSATAGTALTPAQIDCGGGSNVIAGALAPGAIVTCVGTPTAVDAGQHTNLGEVVGDPEASDGTPLPPAVDDTDPANYFGGAAAIDIEKSTNGDQADTAAEAVIVAPGSTVTWTYVVENTGTTSLTNVTVTDDQLTDADIDCDGTGSNAIAGPIAPGATFTCEATGVAVDGSYTNVGSVTGDPTDAAGNPVPDAGPATDADPSNYIAGTAAIDIEKRTNGADADTAGDAVFILVGSPVNWVYEVQNTGTVALTDVTVTDNLVAPADINCSGTGSNAIAGPVLPGESFTCVASGVAQADGYANIGSVSGNPIDGTEPATAADPSNYFGADPALGLEKETNNLDSDTPTGAVLNLGDAVTWTYIVSNDGNVDLANVNVVDDQGVNVVCPSSGNNIITLLAAGATETCSATGVAELGQYANRGDAEGSPVDPAGDPILDAAGNPLPNQLADDPSHYFGLGAPGVSITKTVNGADANTAATAASVVTGDTVVFVYTVTNTGDLDLAQATVTDDQGVVVVCEGSTDNVIALLAVGASVSCTGTGIATAGAYTNIGDVAAIPVDEDGNPAVDENGDPLPEQVADDPANYFGGDSAVDVEKTTNGDQADLPADAVAVTVGDAITWEYTVENTGNLDLTNVAVSDSDPTVTVTCPTGNPIPSLIVGAVEICSASGVAVEGPYTNTALASGVDSNGVTVLDTDDSNYIAAAVPVWNLGDYVWLDENSDGVQDATEPPLAGVDVILTDATGAVLGTETTDAAGSYLFTGLVDGTYTVTVDTATLPAGVSPTFDADGGLDNTSTTTIAGADDLDQDFGYVEDPLFSFGDYVWLDANEDGIQDATESDLAGVDVTLTDATGAVIGTETTDAAGSYLFTGLAPGTYTATVDTATLPAGVFQTFDADGTLDDTSTATITDADVLDQDFGYDSPDPRFAIGDYVWIDANADGVQDADEAPLEGITVTLTDAAGATQTAVTNADGLYLFSGLPAGTYTVTVDATTLPAGLTQTFDADGGLDNTSEVTITTADDLDQDFGYVAVPAVDLEKATNGVDADDAAQAPTVQVGDPVVWTYVVTNSGAVDVTAVTVTDNLVPASDIVCAGSTDNVIPTLAAGDTVTCTANGVATDGAYSNTGTVNAVGPNGEDVEATDPSNYVGTAEPLGTIGDLVWLDVDGDGDPAGEGGIPGVTLELVDEDGITIQTQVTGTDGTYLFTNVPAGTYSVVVNKSVGFPAGLERTFDADGLDTPNVSVVTLAPGAQDLDQDFGYQEPELFEIGDYVWLDNNSDGVQDAIEAPIEGVDVTLTDASGTVIGTATTNVEGLYLFEDVAPGTYTVTVDTATLPANVAATFDADGGLDSESVVTITTADDLDQDFGYVQLQEIGDFVFVDANGNGLQDAGEPGVEGVTVNLWSVDAAGAPDEIIDSAETDADGLYGFTVEPGDYVLQFVTDEQITTQNSGDDALDSDADPATGLTSIVTVLGGVSDRTIDAGIVPLTTGVNIEKTTNGEDADAAPGPALAPGAVVTWTYTVTNTGTATLTEIVVTDDVEGTCTVNDIAPGASDSCTITGVAVEGPYTNNATVDAVPVDSNGDPLGERVTDEDPSNYTGVPNTPGITVEKTTQGQDADTAPGPRLAPGSVVTWTYVITNTGDVALGSVGLNDDVEGGISCPKTTLVPGESMTCTTSGTVIEGQYTNTATVSGTPLDADGNPTGNPIGDTDPSHYEGVPKALPATVVPAPTPTTAPVPAPAPVIVVVQPPVTDLFTPLPAGVPLAVTGRDSTDLALVAATLIVAGAAFVALGRRRSESDV